MISSFGHKTFSSLALRNYRLYFAGQAISQTGTWMQTIALAWLVLKLTNSGVQLGFIAAAQFLPVLLFGSWGGLIADRFDKLKIIFLTQSGFLILALTLGLLAHFDLAKPWMIYLLAGGLGLLNAIDTPTRQSFIHDMVGADRLQNAMSLNATLFNLTRIIGPAIAGIIIAAIGLAPCFFINAASYLAVLLALGFINKKEIFQSVPVRRASGQLRTGFAYVSSQPLLRDILIMMAVVGTFIYEFQISIPLLAKNTFAGDARAYAALTSFMGLGAVLGGLWSASATRPNFRRVTLGILFLGAAMLLASISPNLPLALFAMAVIGFASVNYTSRGNVALQLNSSPQMRGRVLALWNTAFVGTTAIGGPVIGAIGQYAGPRWALATGALSAALAVIYGHIQGKKLRPSEPENLL